MRWTIGRRLAALGATAVCAVLLVGWVGFAQAGKASRQAERASLAAMTFATVNDSQHTASVVLANAYMLAQPVAEERHAEIIEQMVEHTDELRAQVDILAATSVNAEIDAQMPPYLASMRKVLDRSDELAKTRGVVPAGLVASVQGAWDEFDEVSDAVKGLLEQTSTQENEAARNSASRTRTVIAVLALLMAPMLAVAMWLLARSLLRPVTRTKALLEQVSGGDFSQRLQISSRDELGEMASALNTTVDRMGDAIRTIAGEAAALGAASERLDGVSQRMVAGTDRVSEDAAAASDDAVQANRDVRAIATGAEQMRASIGEIARNATEAAGIVADAVRVAQSANETIGRLGESSNEIGEVAKVITSIAEQTNLLALNATIEAARAGEAGKGFAVVASEVKDLAQETAKATDDIGRRIEAIQGDTTDAVGALGQITETINRIAEIQQVIASAVEEQSAATAEIGESVNRAVDRTAGITTRITSVADSSRESSTAAGQTREAATDLATTASSLRQVVTGFRLDR
jgi:methyl-accepting chemotaxis protein